MLGNERVDRPVCMSPKRSKGAILSYFEEKMPYSSVAEVRKRTDDGWLACALYGVRRPKEQIIFRDVEAHNERFSEQQVSTFFHLGWWNADDASGLEGTHLVPSKGCSCPHSV